MNIYCARPRRSFGTEHDRHQLGAVAHWHFPEAAIIDPARLWSSNGEWLAEWGALLPTIDVMVLWSDEGGWLSDGCLREVADAVAEGLPVLTLGREGELRTFGGFRAGPASPLPPATLLLDRHRSGLLVYGPPVTSAELASLRRLKSGPPGADMG
jgi:hypothetical protein